MSVGSVFGLWLGDVSPPSVCNVVHRTQIERSLHPEGPSKRPAALRLVKAPEVRVQVRPSSR